MLHLGNFLFFCGSFPVGCCSNLISVIHVCVHHIMTFIRLKAVCIQRSSSYPSLDSVFPADPAKGEGIGARNRRYELPFELLGLSPGV